MTQRVTVGLPDDVAVRLGQERNASAYVTAVLRAQMEREDTRTALADHGIVVSAEGTARARGRIDRARAKMTPERYAETAQGRAGCHVTDRELRLVLDTSAVLAYAMGSVDVGETIAEVVDEGQWFGASVVCLTTTARRRVDIPIPVPLGAGMPRAQPAYRALATYQYVETSYTRR